MGKVGIEGLVKGKVFRVVGESGVHGRVPNGNVLVLKTGNEFLDVSDSLCSTCMLISLRSALRDGKLPTCRVSITVIIEVSSEN